MEEEYMRVVNITAIGVISWGLTFITIRRIFSNYSFDFSNRIVSSLHAIIGVALATLSIQDWSCPVCPIASKSSLRQMETMAFSLSYMIYDLICGHFDQVISIENAVHHFVCILGFLAGFFYQKCGSEMVATILITEISGPFLHLREILKETGYKDTDLNLVVDVCFATIFSLARMVGGPYIVYVTISADNPILIKAMAVGLQLVSALWFYKILKMMKYKLIKRSKFNQKSA